MGRLTLEANRPKIVPAEKSLLAAHEALTLTFPNSMDPSSVTVSGNIGTVNAGMMTWSTSALSNDTLSLNAAGAVAWTAGSGMTLNVTVVSKGETSTYSYTFDVVRGIFVAKAGTDANTGTTRQPLQTIGAGIAKVQSLYSGSGAVYVSQGTYSGDSQAKGNAGVVNMVDGISLYGGYSSNSWSDRNVATYETTIEDTSTANGGSLTAANIAVYCGATVTHSSTTIIDGFTIRLAGASGSGASNVGVYCSGAPTVQKCKIVGLNTSWGDNAYGIYSNAGGNILNNSITPNTASTTSCGVYLENSTATIDGNSISGGQAAASTYGVVSSLGPTSPTIVRNTIDISITTATNKYCIWIALSHPSITDNKLIFTNGNYAIYEVSSIANDAPASVQRNNFSTNGFIWFHEAPSNEIRPSNYTAQNLTTGDGTKTLYYWANYSSP
jgi:hypothetical protein